MRSTRAAVPALAAAFVLVLALSACSDGGGLDPEAEADLIEDALLTTDDLPDGFEESEASDDDDDETLEDCAEDAGVDPDALDDSTVAETDPAAFEVVEGEGFGGLEAEIRTVDPTGPVEEILELMGDEDFQECILDGFIESAEDGGQEFVDPEIDEADVPVDGDATGGLSFTGEIAGFDFEGEIEVVLVGNHLVSVESTSVNGGLDDSAVEDAFEAMIERLEEES